MSYSKSRSTKIIIAATILLITFIVMIGCIKLLELWQQTNCNDRETNKPNYPISPGSTLLGQEIVMDEDWGAYLSYDYITNDDFENTVAYYRNVSDCSTHLFRGQIRCSGDATPFGEYTIYIDHDPQSEKTTYSVDVWWDRCTSGWTIRIG